MLPSELKLRAIQRARKKGISLGELLRKSLEDQLKRPLSLKNEDPLYTDNAVFSEKTPKDLAGNHDRYLYDVRK